MKKLIKAVGILLVLSSVAAVVYLGVMKDQITIRHTSDSFFTKTVPEKTPDTSRVPENAAPDKDSKPDNPAADAEAIAAFEAAGIPEASGTAVEANDSVIIDFSNTEDGYVMVDYTQDTGNLLKVQVAGPYTTYLYDLDKDVWTTFPLSDGDGGYKVTVYESMPNEKYATVLSASFDVALASEFAPFLHSNQYVNYSDAVNTIAKTAELTAGTTDTLEKVERIYDYVTKNVSYDTQKAASIQTGYLPVLDDVLAEKRGICFDYAALMAGMLRSCKIPCKLVVGYAGNAYHAWISVWTEESGWVDEVIWFDGSMWHRMDPTFASANNGSSAVMEFIGDGNNYTAKYQY